MKKVVPIYTFDEDNNFVQIGEKEITPEENVKLITTLPSWDFIED